MQYAVTNSPVPWFAIGGIDGENLGEVMEAGATQVAIVRAIMEATNPTQATAQLLTQLSRINP
ncbi:thiamine phosphate synthase [Synechocystis sp. B12]|nr:thiamine phosphate synthase [Synechocystis sp. B12]